jgi:putative transposase
MPRKARIIVPGSAHHVMTRGIDGQVVFRDDSDRERLLSLLGKNLLRFNCACYAWVLMDNHYHLLLRPIEADLGSIMRRVNGGYARYFNMRYGRRGYLFQDRFKSLATQELDYLRELIRYIHLNPLRAGIVKSLRGLEKYQWSGHPAMLGYALHEWHDSDSALYRFGRNRKAARQMYLDYLLKGIEEECSGWSFGEALTSEIEITGEDRLAGDREFILKALAKVPKTRSYREQIRRNRPSLESLLEKVAREHGVSPEVAISRGWGSGDVRTISRRDFCTTAKKRYDYSIKEIAEFLDIDSSTVLRTIVK